MKGIISIIITILVIVGMVILLKHSKKPEPQTGTNQSQTTMQTDNQTASNESQTPKAPTEVLMTVTKEGTGTPAKDGDVVSVHYTGYLEDGTKFDSSVDRGTPFEFTLGAGQVIKGWEIGVKGMKVGEIRKLVIPAEFGYGAGGFPGVIPPNATLAFQVELLAINGAK
jgi:peptidylprolyl isomerase